MAIAQQTGRCRSGDVSIFYRRFGYPGRVPLLIVHGLSYFSWDWIDPALALAVDREVVAMDMRGFGDSDWSSAKDYSVPAMGRDIVALMDHLNWSQAILVGHSMGGRSVTYAAAKNPGRAAALVLVDFTPENAPAGSKRVANTVANTPEVFPSVDAAMKYFGKNDRARFEAYLKQVPGGYAVKRDPYFQGQFKRLLETGERPKLGVDMWQLLAEVSCPILSMRGSRSDMYAVETREKMRAANPRVSIVEVDAGHNIAGDNREGFVAAMRSFLASMETQSHEKAR